MLVLIFTYKMIWLRFSDEKCQFWWLMRGGIVRLKWRFLGILNGKYWELQRFCVYIIIIMLKCQIRQEGGERGTKEFARIFGAIMP